MEEILKSMMSYGSNKDQENTVYLSVTERIDEFASKRYASPEVEKYRTVVLRGQKIDELGNEIMVKLDGNGNFEKEGESFVFNKLQLLDGKPSCDIKLGEWIY